MWLFGWKAASPCVRVQPTAYRLHSSSVCDVQRCSSCSCRLWCYISVMSLPVPYFYRAIFYTLKHFNVPVTWLNNHKQKSRVSSIIMILCQSVCFLFPWKSRHRVRLMGQYRTWTIWQYRTSLRIIQSTSSRVCELANDRVTVKWKEFQPPLNAVCGSQNG